MNFTRNIIKSTKKSIRGEGSTKLLFPQPKNLEWEILTKVCIYFWSYSLRTK